ncbi:MAG: hypothetical protein ACI8S6_005459 [Myxococcota bacterium]|jgi:hypothetical protein
MSLRAELKASLPWIGGSLLIVAAVIVYLVATAPEANLLSAIYGIR